jgi:deazaflavin-dependent oxidoreductase (nitroreductase family)
MRVVDFASGKPWHRWTRSAAGTRPGSWVFSRVLPSLDRAAFRWSSGRWTVTSVLAGLPVVMLTTTGAKSGLPRTVPLLGYPVSDGIAVAASNFGNQQDPAWCHNLRRTPQAIAVVDGKTHTVVTQELTGEGLAEAWRSALAIYPGAANYQQRRGEEHPITVFVLREVPATE